MDLGLVKDSTKNLCQFATKLQMDKGLLPQNKMLPEGIVGEGAFGKRVEDSIKFILHGLS